MIILKYVPLSKSVFIEIIICHSCLPSIRKIQINSIFKNTTGITPKKENDHFEIQYHLPLDERPNYISFEDFTIAEDDSYVINLRLLI